MFTSNTRQSTREADGGTKWTPDGKWLTEASLQLKDTQGERWSAAAGELSTTESAFLERSRRLGLNASPSGVQGDSLFGDHFEAGFRDGSGSCSGGNSGGNGGGESGNVATISALRDRLAIVEGENSALRTRARRAEEERAAEAVRGDRASKKLAQVGVVLGLLQTTGVGACVGRVVAEFLAPVALDRVRPCLWRR